MYTKPTFPDVIWDGLSSNTWRQSRADHLDPNPDDWDQIVSEMLEVQRVVIELQNTVASGTMKVKVGYFPCPAAPGLYPVTGIGFRPKLVRFNVSKAPGPLTHFCCGVGVMDEHGNQNSITWAGIFNNCYHGNSSVEKAISTTNVNAITVEAGFVSMDDDGFTVDFTIVNPAFNVQWEAIC